MYNDIRAAVVGSINMDLILNMKKVPEVGENVLGTDYGYANGGNGHVLSFCIINQGVERGSIGRSFQDQVCIALTEKQ